MGSASSLLNFAPRHLSGSREADLPTSHPTGLDALFQSCAVPTLLRHPILITTLWWYRNFNRLPIAYALRLGLGPDLPWVDEPSPGTLRFSAGRILTCLLAYLCRHSLFCRLHCSFRYSFAACRTLPYHLFTRSKASVTGLSPVEFSAQSHSTSELLRTL